MPRFRYRATDSEGNDASGVTEAHSEMGLVQDLRSQGYQVSDVAPEGGRGSALPKLGAVTLSDLLLFNEQLRSMLSRDLPLPKALRLLASETWSRRFGQAVERVAEGVERGETLSSALSQQSNVFPPLYVGVIEAGEASQNLPAILGALTRYSRAVHGLRRKLVAAATYPLVAVTLSLIIVLGIVTVIAPQFEVLYEEVSRDVDGTLRIPRLTRVVFGLSELLVEHPLGCIGAVIAFVAGLWMLRRAAMANVALRTAWDTLKLKLPGGRLYERLLMVRFCRTLSVLLKANVPMDQALALTQVSCGNAALSRGLENLQNSVTEGTPFSTGFEREVSIFPHSMRFMLATSERRGDLPEELERLGALYEEEADTIGRRLTDSWQVCVMLLMTTIISSLIIALFQPLTHLMGSIGQ